MKKQGALMKISKLKEVLRLSELKHSQVEISKICKVSRWTVQEYQRRSREGGIDYLSIKELSDEEIFVKLDKPRTRAVEKNRPEINFELISRELQRKAVTLELLWQEQHEGQPDAYSYSTFCRKYKRWELKHKVSYRQFYKPGEKAFFDFSGMTVSYGSGGEPRKAEVFVGTLGASNYTYVEATESQELSNWLGAQRHCFEYFGGVPEIGVPDNLRSAVDKACRYEPAINLSYQEFAEYYGIAIIPARAKKPKDKAKVEKAVQDIQTRILAPLRDKDFHSLAEINAAIKPLLVEFNSRKMQEYDASRRELWESLDKPALKALPALPFEFSTWKQARVNIDYHIEFNKHYYSVPYYLVRKEVWIKATQKAVEIFFENKCIALHMRDYRYYKHTTLFEHMPPSHQAYKSTTRASLELWSKNTGAETALFVQRMFARKDHPEQAFRAVLGLQRLTKKYGSVRLENACKRGNRFELFRMHNIRSILETEQDKLALSEQPKLIAKRVEHRNLRGSAQFH